MTSSYSIVLIELLSEMSIVYKIVFRGVRKHVMEASLKLKRFFKVIIINTGGVELEGLACKPYHLFKIMKSC